jgi:hypothetical protein
MNILPLILIGTTLLSTGGHTLLKDNIPSQYIKNSSITVPYSSIYNFDLFNKVIDHIMRHDSALNIGMNYIAYNFECDYDENLEMYIENSFADYNVNVFSSTLENLSTSEYSDNNGDLKGIFITINDITYNNEEVLVSFVKYRSNKKYITAKSNFKKINGTWKH